MNDGDITLYCPLCGKRITGKTERGVASKLRKHTASVACRREAERDRRKRQEAEDADLLPARFTVSHRGDRFALVCTDLDPLSAATFFNALTPGEAWEPSQVRRPEECSGHPDCWHILLAKTGRAFVN